MVNYGGFDGREAEIQGLAVPIQMQYREEGHYSVSSGSVGKLWVSV